MSTTIQSPDEAVKFLTEFIAWEKSHKDEPFVRWYALTQSIGTLLAEHARNTRHDPKDTDGKDVVFFLDQDSFGAGALLHDRRAAHQWLDAFFDNLDVGETERVDFRRAHMTQAEIDALPEI